MRKDNYGILARTTEALTKIKVAEDYQQADKMLMDYIGKQVHRAKDIKELLDIWSYSIKGLELLNFRRNKLIHKGEGVSPDRKMLRALETGTTEDAYDTEHGFSKLNLEGLDHVNEAYSIDFYTTDADKTGLASAMVLDYLGIGDFKGLYYYEPVVESVKETYREDLCYIDAYPALNLRGRFYDFKLGDATFVGMFGAGLRDLLSREQSVLSLEIKKIVNDLLVATWTGFIWEKLSNVYSELEEVLTTDRTEISPKLGRYSVYIKDFALVREYSEDRIYYRLNMEALKVFVKMIKDLGLDDLDENKLILDLIAQRQV